MSEHKPPTDKELAEWKAEVGNQVHFCVTRNEALNPVETVVCLHRLLDCIEEINRLRAEVESVKLAHQMTLEEFRDQRQGIEV